MAGFTPINASNAGSAALSDNRSRGRGGASDGTSTRTVASDYLGREEDLPAAPLPKKTNTKEKKRAATTGESSRTKKRRKSSNVDDGLHVTKSRAGDHQSSQSNHDDNPQKTAKPKKKSTATKQAKKASATVSKYNADDGGLATKPVSVYAQATSMDALDSTSARTSFDSVKANAGQSFTLYQGPSSTASFSSSIEISQPWLNTASKKTKASSINQLPTPQPSDDFQILSDDDDIFYEHVTAQEKSAERKLTTKFQNDSVLQDSNGRPTSSPRDFDEGNRRSTRPKKEVNYAVEQSFPTIDLTEDVQPKPQNQAVSKSTRRQIPSPPDDEGEFGELLEDEAVEVTKEVEEAVEERRPHTPPPRGRKQNIREVDEDEDYGGALLTDAERKLLAKMKNASEGKIRPIVRKPFQPAILDRSPVFGASKSVVLRTSFRVGEALNFGAQAVRTNNNAIIELYARVTVSRREGRKQHFLFKDLYHDKPPYLEGTYELFDQALLWDLDSKPFLKARGPGILSRVIARMKREGQKWRLEILNIWEASWEDVNYVAGIYTGETYEEDEYNI